jgi:ABC-type transporter Mla MlaB component
VKLRIIKKRGDDNRILLTLIGEITIYSISRLKEILMKELSDFSGMVLNLAQVNEADTAAFQLLVFLKREAEITGKSFMIDEPGGRLKAVFDLYKEKI